MVRFKQLETEINGDHFKTSDLLEEMSCSRTSWFHGIFFVTPSFQLRFSWLRRVPTGLRSRSNLAIWEHGFAQLWKEEGSNVSFSWETDRAGVSSTFIDIGADIVCVRTVRLENAKKQIAFAVVGLKLETARIATECIADDLVVVCGTEMNLAIGKIIHNANK